MKPHHRICLAAFLMDSTVMMTFVVTPFFVYRQLGGGPGMSGTFGALHMGAYALGCLATAGLVSRARNGLHCALAGVGLFVASFSLMPFFRSPMLCAIVSTAAFLGLALVWPALHSWIGAHPDPKVRSRHVALFNISWSFGFATSPLLAGPLYDLDHRLPFVALFVLGAAIALLLRSLPHEKSYFGEATEELLIARANHDRRNEEHLYAAWLATLVANALAGVTRSVFPKRIEELVAGGELRLLPGVALPSFLQTGAATTYSWLAFALSITTAACFVVMGRTHWWRHRFGLLVGLQMAAAAAFWLLGRVDSLLAMFPCFIAVGAAVGATFFASVYYSLSDARHKHRRAAINEGAVGVGGFAGSIVFGLLAERFGMGFPFRYTPYVVAAGLAAQWALIRWRGSAPCRRPCRSDPVRE